MSKIMLATEFLLIAYILFIIPAQNTKSDGGVSVFLPEDNVPLIFETEEIPETFKPEEQTEEITAETAEKIAEPETTEEEETTNPEIPTEEPTTGFKYIDGVGYVEDDGIPEEYTGPKQFEGLHYAIRKYGRGVSVYYKDLTDGEEYFFNPDENYFIASLIKAPYVAYVYKRLIEMGDEYDPEEKYIYNKSDYREGTGKIKLMEYGTEFTLEELLSYAIRWSDNVAMDMIRKSIFPVSGFLEYAEEIGFPHLYDIRQAVNGRICARCAAVYIEAIYNFIEEGNIYSEILKEHMLNTVNKMIYASYPFVRKYGWAEDSFHDMGIVYNEERPYLIVILSDRGLGNFPMFKEISLAIEQYNESKPFEPEEVEVESEIEIEKIEETTEIPTEIVTEITTELPTTEKPTEIITEITATEKTEEIEEAETAIIETEIIEIEIETEPEIEGADN